MVLAANHLLARAEEALATRRDPAGLQADHPISLALCLDGVMDASEARSGLYPAYSISKSFIATLLVSLCEAGALALDDTLERWLPELPRANEISLRRLLNHSAGVPDYGGLAAYHDAVRRSPREPWSQDDFARHTFDKGLAHPPGQGWAYSNPGYMLAVRLAERVADESFDDLLHARIAAPLELASTRSPRELKDLCELVSADSTQLHPSGEAREMKQNYHPGWVAHRFVISRPLEIAAFYQALFAGQLIGPRLLEEMKRLIPVPHSHPRIAAPGYGLGLMGDLASEAGETLGHNGGGPGYSASAFHFASFNGQRVTLCVMAVDDSGERAERVLFEAVEQLRAER